MKEGCHDWLLFFREVEATGLKVISQDSEMWLSFADTVSGFAVSLGVEVVDIIFHMRNCFVFVAEGSHS